MIRALARLLVHPVRKIDQPEILRQNIIFSVLSLAYTLMIALMAVGMLANLEEVNKQQGATVPIVLICLVIFTICYGLSRYALHGPGSLLFCLTVLSGCFLAVMAEDNPLVASAIPYMSITMILASFLLSVRMATGMLVANFLVNLYILIYMNPGDLPVFNSPSVFNLVACVLLLVGTWLHQKNISDIQSDRMVLRESERLASLGEMAGGIAHEINNPLAIIRSSVGLMLKMHKSGKLTDDKFENLTDKIVITSERIQKIINSMRNISRDSMDEELLPESLNDIIDEVVSLCAERFREEKIRFALKVPPDTSVVCGRVQLSQVLVNLLNNAVDAVRDQEDKQIRIAVDSSAGRTRIAVEDSGTGVDQELVSKIFNPFFTTKKVNEGTGIGLSLCKTLVEKMDGRIYVDQGSSKGTRFVVEFKNKPAIQKIG